MPSKADIIRFGVRIRCCTPHWNGDYSLRRFSGTLTSKLLAKQYFEVGKGLTLSSGYITSQGRLPKINAYARPFRNSSTMGENPPDEEAPFPLTDVDRWVLSQTDEEFHKHDWEELRTIIGKFPKLETLAELNSTLRLSMSISSSTICCSNKRIQRQTTFPSSNAHRPNSKSTWRGQPRPKQSMVQ